MEKIVWGSHSFKGDPTKVMNEIRSLGEEVKPAQIVDYAKSHEDSELYKCFTWDKDEAAEKYLLYEARQIVRNLTITVVEDDSVKEKKEFRVFYRTEETSAAGYKPMDVIVSRPDEYANLLTMAKIELNRFMNKYQTLSELEPIFDAIKQLLAN